MMRSETCDIQHRQNPEPFCESGHPLLYGLKKAPAFSKPDHRNSLTLSDGLPENQTDFHLDQMPDGVSREHFQNEVLGEDARKIYRHFSSIIDLILKHKQPFGLSKRCKLHRPVG